MGSNQFQKEYIEYLQERNTELIGRLNHMKEYYENKVLSRDLNRHYLMSTLQDMSHICTEIPQEIDLFFDKMTAAMNILKNVLLRKAEMVQLVEKISKVISTTEYYNTDLVAVDDSSLLKKPASGIRSNKKTGMVKVSPMINGHIISTEPKIYLNRVPEVFTPVTSNGTHQLSPIIEASPDISSDTSNTGMFSFKEISIPVERLNLNKAFNYMSEESPKSRFKGPKTWKKSLSSTKCQSENQRNQPFSENKENVNKKISVGEIENVDPLEGPSWLHNESETSSSPSNFMDYRRRKHRFAIVFDKNEDCSSPYEVKAVELSRKGEDKEEQDDDRNSNEDRDSDEDHNGDGDAEDEDDLDEDDNGGDDGDADDEFYENPKTNTDKEDFEESRKRNSESSVDLFCDSSTSGFEEKISPFKKINPLNKRKRPKHDDKGSVEKIFTNHSKKKKNTLIPSRVNYPNKKDNKVQDIKSKKCYRKRRSKSLFEKTNPRMSFKESSKSEYRKQNTKNSISENSDSGAEQRNSSAKGILEKELFVSLEDCILSKEIPVSEKPKTKASNEKRPSRNTLTGESQSPKLLVESEGRKKRKAAPTFKLVEPKLSTKLRRD